MFLIDGRFFNYNSAMKKKEQKRKKKGESNLLSHPFHEPKCFLHIFTLIVCYLHSTHDMLENDIL